MREFGPFSDRSRQGTLLGGVTVNRADKGNLGAFSTQKTSTGSGTPTVMPIKAAGTAARDAKVPMDLLAQSERNLRDEVLQTNEALEASKEALSGLLQDLAHGVKPIDALTSALSCASPTGSSN